MLYEEQWPIIYMNFSRKVHWLTMILSWNVTKCGLFFNIVLLAVYTLLSLVLQYLDPIDKKKSSTLDMTSSYELYRLPL